MQTPCATGYRAETGAGPRTCWNPLRLILNGSLYDGPTDVKVCP